MFGIILLYLLCTMCSFWRNAWSCISRHGLRGPAKHCVYYSRTALIRKLVVRIANCTVLVGTSEKFVSNSTQL